MYYYRNNNIKNPQKLCVSKRKSRQQKNRIERKIYNPKLKFVDILKIFNNLNN